MCRILPLIKICSNMPRSPNTQHDSPWNDWWTMMAKRWYECEDWMNERGGGGDTMVDSAGREGGKWGKHRGERWVKRAFSSTLCPSATGQWCVWLLYLLYLDGLLIWSTGWRGPPFQSKEALRSLKETGSRWRMWCCCVLDLTDISFTHPLRRCWASFCILSYLSPPPLW